MAGSEFKPGDVVALKSGGPAMTIESTTARIGAKIVCLWFLPDATGVRSGEFPAEALIECEAHWPAV